MKVSVVMPVYNKAPFLREAVDSILHGSFSAFEFIAVDDKSTDGSLDVLRRIDDPRIRILELPTNLGPAGAANAGLDAAQGEYIVRMDADDIAIPERIAKQVAFMDAHPEIGASGGHVRLFGAEQSIWYFPIEPDACAARLLFGVPVPNAASILRRSVLDEHGLRYDPTWPHKGEDWLFWLRMERVSRLANLDMVLLHYRRGAQNISRGRDPYADHSFLQREVFDWFNIPYSTEELELHLMGSTIFKRRPTKARIRALREWYDRLATLNTTLTFAPQAELLGHIAAQWDRLFHYLPRFGASPAIEHLRIDRKWPMDRLAYLAKYRMNAWLGRIANG